MEFIPFALQGLVMSVDEFHCHRNRVMRRWERWGHPLDTFSFLLCLAFIWLSPPEPRTLWVYLFLATASCLLITKDEWQHKELASAFENWLHALLFILHPVTLVWAGYLWWTKAPAANWVLPTALTLCVFFMIHQIVFWNFWRKND